MTTSEVEISKIQDIENERLAAAVYLLPVGLSDNNPRNVLPNYNLEILRKIKHFVVENQRSARRFLKKVDKTINIDSLTFYELNEHTDESLIQNMTEPLLHGIPVGVMSEAGCPAIADPGARIVEWAQRHDVKVVPLVGPSSILLSLMASGFNGQNFTFNGYLPIKDKERDNCLRALASKAAGSGVTQIFIETPYRNSRLLRRMLEILPASQKICVAADVTGARENIRTRTVAEWKKVSFDFDKTPAIFLLGR